MKQWMNDFGSRVTELEALLTQAWLIPDLYQESWINQILKGNKELMRV